MKYLIYAMSTVFLLSCKSDKTSPNSDQTAEVESDEPDWILGNWERVGEKEGTKTYEYWKQNKAGEFIGMGCTLREKDTIWREDVLLARDSKGWKFEVLSLGDTVSTVFRITQMSKAGFVCENEKNDFPKKIEYAYDGENINAMISGGGPTIPFNFIPMKQ